MLLVLRALLVLGLATLLHAAGKGQAVSLRLGQGVRPRGKTVRLILDPSVRPQMASTSTSTIANMSLSPWTYRDSCVASRLPQRISHAHCLTSGCLSLPGGRENAALEAKPIYYQVLVLHRVRRPRRTKNGKMKNRYDFRLGTEVITVGCTCVRPSVLPQQ
ncbi:interleukin 17a/f3 [Sebastes umbrosus]|uniref:interleukin 17a/f3 n=1 Tax=Sebastes umbrosus TaxID=72105 RepID=UPI00189F9B93|nr:interleukin 17a/f3 [Sebastes umbrosus]